MPITATDHEYVKLSDQMDEESLWLEFKRGDKKSYSFIYEQYSDNLYQYGMHMVKNNHLVEDAIQDLFVNLWRCRKNLTCVKSIKFYLLTCLRREIIKKIKKEHKFISDHNTSYPKSFQFETSIEDDIIEDEVSLEKQRKLDHVLKPLIMTLHSRFFRLVHNKVTGRVWAHGSVMVLAVKIKTCRPLRY